MKFYDSEPTQIYPTTRVLDPMWLKFLKSNFESNFEPADISSWSFSCNCGKRKSNSILCQHFVKSSDLEGLALICTCCHSFYTGSNLIVVYHFLVFFFFFFFFRCIFFLIFLYNSFILYFYIFSEGYSFKIHTSPLDDLELSVRRYANTLTYISGLTQWE